MAEFKGFDNWIEIFRGGTQIDSQGTTHDGDRMIDKAVASFNASSHEPPLVIGHPKSNAPAYGWVREVKSEVRDGIKTLLMKAGQVVPEFEELVRNGQYKKRSASFYPDGRLRHVGFLGAVPPAVKGLADLSFGEDESVVFEFYDYQTSVIGRLFGRIRDYFIEKDGVEAADRVIPEWDVDFLKEEANRQPEPAVAEYSDGQTKQPIIQEDSMAGNTDTLKNFSEADLRAAEEQAAAKARQETEAKFADADRKRRINEFCDRYFPKNGEGKLPPALLDGGVQEFMERLDHGEPVSFSENKEQTALEWFMDFLEKLPQAVSFKEIAGRGQADLPDNEDAEDIARRAREFQESEKAAGRVIAISDAVSHVTRGRK